jgi:hypothetical protein
MAEVGEIHDQMEGGLVAKAKSLNLISDERNPRGIPAVNFVVRRFATFPQTFLLLTTWQDNVEEFLKAPGVNVELVIGAAQDLYGCVCV